MTGRKSLSDNSNFRLVIERYDSIADAYQPGEYEKMYDRYIKSLAEYNKLSAEKKQYIGKPTEPMGKWNFRRPVGLSETMLNVVSPYTLKGFIFYQGESNTARGAQYRKLFPAMIKEWRASWGQEDIPFLFVQLPRFETKTRYWNELREAQYLTSLHVKNTGMAVAFDQGNPKDIHPIVKIQLAGALHSWLWVKFMVRRSSIRGLNLEKRRKPETAVYFWNL